VKSGCSLAVLVTVGARPAEKAPERGRLVVERVRGEALLHNGFGDRPDPEVAI
jgi:hypothetical protein